jgi:hypothetical protein
MSNSVDELIISCLAVDGLEIEFGTGLTLGINPVDLCDSVTAL